MTYETLIIMAVVLPAIMESIMENSRVLADWHTRPGKPFTPRQTLRYSTRCLELPVPPSLYNAITGPSAWQPTAKGSKAQPRVIN